MKNKIILKIYIEQNTNNFSKDGISIANFPFASGSIMAQCVAASKPQPEGREPAIIQIIINYCLIIINYPNDPKPQNRHCSLWLFGL